MLNIRAQGTPLAAEIENAFTSPEVMSQVRAPSGRTLNVPEALCVTGMVDF